MSNRRQFAQSGALIAGAVLLGACRSSIGQQQQPVADRLLRVGPSRDLRTIGAAAHLARPGATIEVDAGDYAGDVAVWTHDQLTVRAVGGRVRLLANGAAAEGKGIWVVRAPGMRVDGFDFEGAAVPARNGAGIRLESGSLSVRNCRFFRNEMGLLTSNDPTVVLDVENCEFAHNQRTDGHNHNLYAGRIAKLSLIGCHIHHAHIGHLLKSRAAQSHILYNRITDQTGGRASYELEFPNGGLAYVIGNIIEQGPGTENPKMISMGAETYTWGRNAIYLVNNTLVNGLPHAGVFLAVASGASPIYAANNLLVGSGALESAGPGDYRNNFTADSGDFISPSEYDFRLSADSRLVGLAKYCGFANGQPLDPSREYAHPRNSRPLAGNAHNPGAMQSMTQPPST